MKGEWKTMFNIITTKNSKFDDLIAQVNMPYCVSCRPDAPCFKECYANKGNMRYKSVVNAHMKRYNMYKADPKGFFAQIDMEMNFIKYNFFRWHSSGDIVDMQYLDLMCKLARKHRETNFLCFTKKYEIVNEYLYNHRRPSNLVIMFSNWGDFIAPNPHNLPTAWVKLGTESDKYIPKNAKPCDGKCTPCIMGKKDCWRMKCGESRCLDKH